MQKKIYLAHTENEKGEVHQLYNHLRNTAEIAAGFAINKDLEEILKVAGLLHDLGKYQDEFQNYLLKGGRRGSVPHAKWGAMLTRKLHYKELSFCIDGHHAGIPDYSKWDKEHTYISDDDIETKSKLKDLLRTFLDETQLEQKDLLIHGFNIKSLNDYERELLIRYIFSALTDADWLDTEAHFDSEKSKSRIKIEFTPDLLIEKLDNFFMTMNKDREINKLRNDVRNFAVSKAKDPCGFFTLNLPTGLGKTYTSVFWALHHAKANNLKRIIMVLPFISIIDQTAQILKERFGEEIVLEHHSNLTVEENDENGYNRRKLACENWDYPIIITTTVQFFESLFSNKSSKCRKIHNIAESVVIFDEVQSLPKEVVLPSLTMLISFQKLLKTSFLFCTATLPAFRKRDNFDGIDHMISLVENPENLFKITRRVEYHVLNNFQNVDVDSLFESVLKTKESALVIFNTKKDALLLYKRLQKADVEWDKIYHLSTNMCPDHRKKIIKSIREDLMGKNKIIVSSTQLIEAGVDFDFPVVFRASAPLESIIQSAGRCNREGKLNEPGKVFLFEFEGNGMPDKTYRACADHAKNLISEDINLLYKYDFFEEYYRQILSLYVDADKKGINDERKKWNFKTVNDLYSIIDSPTEAVFIKYYNTESISLYKSIEYKPFLSRSDFRKIQNYSVNVYSYFLQKNFGWFVEMGNGLKIWNAPYSSETGISINPEEDIDWNV